MVTEGLPLIYAPKALLVKSFFKLKLLHRSGGDDREFGLRLWAQLTASRTIKRPFKAGPRSSVGIGLAVCTKCRLFIQLWETNSNIV